MKTDKSKNISLRPSENFTVRIGELGSPTESRSYCRSYGRRYFWVSALFLKGIGYCIAVVLQKRVKKGRKESFGINFVYNRHEPTILLYFCTVNLLFEGVLDI